MVHLTLVDHSELFNSLKNTPIIVNNVDVSSTEGKEYLNNQIYTSYTSDSLEALPSCDCGHLTGEYNVGLVCGECGSVCLSLVERPLESILWIAPPEGVDTLFNPEAWVIFRNHLTHGGVNLMEWMCDPRMAISGQENNGPLALLKRLYKEMEAERGLNYLHENFDDIFDTIVEHGKRLITAKSSRQREMFIQFVRENRHKLFSSHLPIPSKLMFITEKASTGKFADESMNIAIDAIRTVSDIENSIEPLNIASRQKRSVQVIQKLADYYQTFFKSKLGEKTGWFRKHVFGSRLHFSFRAVISSISEPHHHTELHLPWSMSVMFLKTHLTGKLLKRGFTPNEAIRYLYEHTLKYDYLLDEIFQELIAEGMSVPEAPYEGGIPVILQRNPTLTRLSAQRLCVTKIKTDVNINTVSVSNLVLAGMN